MTDQPQHGPHHRPESESGTAVGAGSGPAEPAPELGELVERVGNLIHTGQIPSSIGHEAIGAVAAWRAGYEDIALAEMDPARLAAVEAALRRAGVDIPWPPRAEVPGSDPQP